MTHSLSRISLTVFVLTVAAAALAGFDAGLSAAAGGLAVLLPELMYQAQLARLQRRRAASVMLAMRYKMLRLASIIVFLAVSLRVLGPATDALAWMLAVSAQALLPLLAVVLLPVARRAKQ